MAFKMAYTDETGTEHPDCYWKVAETNLAHWNKTGRVVFLAYHDQAARDAEKQPLTFSKAYTIDPTLYTQYFAPAKQDQEGENSVKATYDMALAVKEGDTPKEGEEDKRKSFFDGAENV